MKQNILLALCLSASSVLFAQQSQNIQQLDSVLIDTKIQLSRKNSGKVIAKITSEMLERSAGRSVAEIVNQVSGIEINGSRSNEGQNLGYFVRGGRNRQVVIMIDGVQLNDPSQIANDYDLRLIPATSVESIEIIKGASSVLYGSGAATAVIRIVTKKTSEKPISATFSSTLGTNRAAENEDSDIEEFTNHAVISGTLQTFFYDVSFSNRYVEGLSAIAALENEPTFEADVFNRFDGRINVGYTDRKNFRISRFFSFDTYKAGFDDSAYVDADNLSVSKQKRAGGNVQWKYRKGSITFNDNFSWIERDISSLYPVKYDSRSYTFDAFANHKINNEIMVLAGINGNFSSFNSFTIPFGSSEFSQDVSDDVAKFDSMDPYLNFVYLSDFGLNINTGIRLNIHSTYGNHIVYNVNPSYNFDFGKNTLKVLGSYSTAYITPSLYQLYDSLYGNEALQPEENTTIEGGFEFTSENNLRVSAVYFNRNETNYVDFVVVDPALYSYQYQNIEDEFSASGVEVEVSKNFGKRVTISANYTNTQADERFALRIPKHKLNASLGYQLGKKAYAGISYQYNGEREDSFFNPLTYESENIILNSYGLLDLAISHTLSKNLKLFAAVSNILDEEYEELYRFQTRGRNLRAGFTLVL
jgi:vitamin B12 transporter